MSQNADQWLGHDRYDALALPDLSSDCTPFRAIAVQKLEYCEKCDVLMAPGVHVCELAESEVEG